MKSVLAQKQGVLSGRTPPHSAASPPWSLLLLTRAEGRETWFTLTQRSGCMRVVWEVILGIMGAGGTGRVTQGREEPAEGVNEKGWQW